MKHFKKIICLALALLMVIPAVTAFADEEPADEPAAQVPEIDYLDTSAIDGKLIAYKGIEAYFVVYPFPVESESRFDIYKAEITCSDDSVIEVKPDRGEQARFGSVLITGKKLGSATVTVTEPESGKTCEVEVIVIPSIGYYIRNFFMNLEYVPFFVFMRIVSILNQFGIIK